KYPFATLLSARDRNANRFSNSPPTWDFKIRSLLPATSRMKTNGGCFRPRTCMSCLRASDRKTSTKVLASHFSKPLRVVFHRSEQTPVAFPMQLSMEKRACSLNRIRPKRSHKLLLSFTETLPFACEWEWQQENGRVRSFPQASSRHSFTKRCHCASRLPVCAAVAS